MTNQISNGVKVLFPATHYYPVIGGIETWTRNIAERLSQKAEVFVVTGKVKGQPNKEKRNGVEIWRTSLFTLTNLSASPLFYSLSLMPFIFFKSLNLIKKEKIDILHCQGFLSSFLGFWLSKMTGIPYIVTVQRLERRGNPIKETVYRGASYCIGASRAIKSYFEAVGAKNIEVVPNGIDLEKFVRLKRQPHAGFVVMTVARLEKVKGIEYLIKSISNLKSQISNLACLIIGDGSERNNLEKLVERLNLRDKVKFLGEVSNEQIPEYLAGADCFVLPSLREGFGISILEAQAAGIPVIGTKIGGILDLVKDGETGILVEPKNPEALAKAIREIYSGRKFTQPDLGKYNWQNIAERVFNVYQKCLD